MWKNLQYSLHPARPLSLPRCIQLLYAEWRSYRSLKAHFSLAIALTPRLCNLVAPDMQLRRRSPEKPTVLLSNETLGPLQLAVHQFPTLTPATSRAARKRRSLDTALWLFMFIADQVFFLFLFFIVCFWTDDAVDQRTSSDLHVFQCSLRVRKKLLVFNHTSSQNRLVPVSCTLDAGTISVHIRGCTSRQNVTRRRWAQGERARRLLNITPTLTRSHDFARLTTMTIMTMDFGQFFQGHFSKILRSDTANSRVF